MTQQSVVETFLSHKTLALAGVSRSGKKFGNAVLKALKIKGYEVLVVHPEVADIDGHACFPSLAELPDRVGGLILVVPPVQTEKLVREAHSVGILNIWMQQGSESKEAVIFCQDNDMAVISGECILMYAQPQGFHKFHHWLWGILGKRPKAHA
ncbi:MAG: CoA-binding protein [Candidatus Marinimicrobia bacterium]|nr:CoA-binding protein [Candidatus Neomarinimicrobiota bacterium]